jgi:streptomycin 6-kinase
VNAFVTGERVDFELVPTTLPVVATVREHDGGPVWLAELPQVIEELRERWSLRLGAPFHGGSCSWVAPAWPPDGEPAVLKITWPHREAMGEAEGLRLWDGRGVVRLLREDRERLAVLVERCEPGVALGEAHHLDPRERLEIGARLLDELWSVPVPEMEPEPGLESGAVPAPKAEAGAERTELEGVADLTAQWADLVEERMDRLKPDFDPGLVALGARLLRELPATAPRTTLVHGDFNPGNVLSARRRPWLAIDAKPMIGDPGYDPWPLLAQIDEPFAHPDPLRVLAERFALVGDVVGEDVRRLVAWALAREVESALWAADHPQSPIAYGSMEKAGVLARLAEV